MTTKSGFLGDAFLRPVFLVTVYQYSCWPLCEQAGGKRFVLSFLAVLYSWIGLTLLWNHICGKAQDWVGGSWFPVVGNLVLNYAVSLGTIPVFSLDLHFSAQLVPGQKLDGWTESCCSQLSFVLCSQLIPVLGKDHWTAQNMVGVVL